MVLLQIRTTPLEQGLPSPATLLFNHLVCDIMPVMDRKLTNIDNDDEPIDFSLEQNILVVSRQAFILY